MKYRLELLHQAVWFAMKVNAMRDDGVDARAYNSTALELELPIFGWDEETRNKSRERKENAKVRRERGGLVVATRIEGVERRKVELRTREVRQMALESGGSITPYTDRVDAYEYRIDDGNMGFQERGYQSIPRVVFTLEETKVDMRVKKPVGKDRFGIPLFQRVRRVDLPSK